MVGEMGVGIGEGGWGRPIVVIFDIVRFWWKIGNIVASLGRLFRDLYVFD